MIPTISSSVAMAASTRPGIVGRITTTKRIYRSLNFTKSPLATTNLFTSSTAVLRTMRPKAGLREQPILTAFATAIGSLLFLVMDLIRLLILKIPIPCTRNGSTVAWCDSIASRANVSISAPNQRPMGRPIVGTGIRH